MRRLLVSVLVLTMAVLLPAQDLRQEQAILPDANGDANISAQSGVNASNQEPIVTGTEQGQQPTASQPVSDSLNPKAPQAAPQLQPHRPWYKNGVFWAAVGLFGGLAAGGGYLLSDGGSMRRVGGGAMIGLDVFLFFSFGK